MGVTGRRAAVLAVVSTAMAILVGGCQGGKTPNPGGGTTGESGASTASPGVGTTGTGGSGGGGGKATPTAVGGGAGGALSFGSLWSRRTSLVGDTVTVDGTVLFALQCPPPGPSPTPCVAVAYLADDALGSLPAQPADVALPLYDNGKAIGCSASTVAGLTCSGWQQSGRYRLLGVVRHQVAAGRELPNLVFDSTQRAPR
jgi:hypothetical protein